MTPAQIREAQGLLALRRRQSEELLPVLVAAREALETQGRAEAARVHNVLEFANLYGYEFSCLLEDVIDHQGELRGMLYARLLVLLVYETSEKLRHLLGGQLQNDLKALGYTDDDINTVRLIHKCFVDAFERCNQEFGDVRDGVVAHRDVSASRQLELIRRTDVRSVIDMTLEMEQCMMRLSALLALESRRLLETFRAELQPTRSV